MVYFGSRMQSLAGQFLGRMGRQRTVAYVMVTRRQRAKDGARESDPASRSHPRDHLL